MQRLPTRFGRALVFLAALMAGAPALAAAPPCSLEDGGAATVSEILDTQTVGLEDGRQVRLIGALPVSANGATGSAVRLEDKARELLEELLMGRRVLLGFGGRRTDRHGRQLAHLFLAEEPSVWAQAALVESGLARVYSFADNRQCVGDLLAREAVARQAGKGLWAGGHGTILRSDRPGEVLLRVGRFEIVEGRVLSVGERPARTYLNFGTYWNADFTVIVSGRDRERFAEAGIDLAAMSGKVVRVRGWILDDRGPAVEATHPEQIEVVDER